MPLILDAPAAVQRPVEQEHPLGVAHLIMGGPLTELVPVSGHKAREERIDRADGSLVEQHPELLHQSFTANPGVVAQPVPLTARSGAQPAEFTAHPVAQLLGSTDGECENDHLGRQQGPPFSQVLTLTGGSGQQPAGKVDISRSGRQQASRPLILGQVMLERALHDAVCLAGTRSCIEHDVRVDVQPEPLTAVQLHWRSPPTDAASPQIAFTSQ